MSASPAAPRHSHTRDRDPLASVRGPVLGTSGLPQMSSEKTSPPSPRQPMLEGGQPAGGGGSRLGQYVATLSATLGAMASGCVLAWTSPALPLLASDLSQGEASWVSSLVAVGALLGALPAGLLADRLGRRLALAALCGPFLLAWLGMGLARGALALCAARLLAGAAVGAVSVVAPIYIGEVAEPAVRGALGAYFQLMMTAGVLWTYAAGAAGGLRAIAAVCALPAAAFLLAMLAAPESPAQLASSGRPAAAERVLRRLRGPGFDAAAEAAALRRAAEAGAAGGRITPRQLARSPAMRIALALMLLQQLSGINAIVFYVQPIFEMTGSGLDPAVASVIVGLLMVVAVYASSLLVDRAGRRPLLLLSAAVMAVCLGALGLYFRLRAAGRDVSALGWLPLLAVGIYVVSFSLGFGPLPWTMMGELFDSRAKAAAGGLAAAANWTMAFLVTKTFGDLTAWLGPHGAFWLFGAVCVAAVAYVRLAVPETKGKSLSQIQWELGGGRGPEPDAEPQAEPSTDC